MLFLFCIGTCKLTSRSRMALTFFLIVLSYGWGETWATLFLAGLFLADVSFSYYPERHSPQLVQSQEPVHRPQPIYQRIFFTFVLFVAMILLSQPAPEMPPEWRPW
jgi:hypothetical protein